MTGWNTDLLTRLTGELLSLRSEMQALEQTGLEQAGPLDPAHQDSARNLLHYMALRRRDLRIVQVELAELGLSSLGRCEGHVRSCVEAVLAILHHLTQQPWDPGEERVPGLNDGKQLLQQHTKVLLGGLPPHREVRIMVTMPSEAATDYVLVRDLLAGGMDVMRINCAHDDPATWERMIANLRRAEQALGRKCHVFMDLGGPKLRTGPLEPGPPVLKWRPGRNDFGITVAPARIWLHPGDQPVHPPAPADAALPLPGSWLAELRVGDQLRFRDARGARRSMKIVAELGPGRWAESTKTTYMISGIRLRIKGSAGTKRSAAGRVGNLPTTEQPLLLRRGDSLVLTRDPLPGRPALRDNQGKLLAPARIPCTLPEIFDDVRVGDRVWLDDGKIGGVIREVRPGEASLEITQARAKGEWLRADKGINLPDTPLRLPALTAKDIEDLAFIARHADAVSLSFVRRAEDVTELQERLRSLHGERLGVVLKIETRQGFEQLPSLLLAAMRSPVAGVMIARGDLAVECGYERLAEIQEEMLWICEAAHMPVIWATQVLETLAKEGQPSRAEITDAAMSERAECVMLNKGPHIVEAVRVLDDILRRMQGHQHKKRSMLRPLSLAHRFNSQNGGA